MGKNKGDQQQPDQNFLNEELESLYKKVAEENLADPGNFRDAPPEGFERLSESTKNQDTQRTDGGPGRGPGANAVAKFFLYFLPCLLIVTFALFVWPTPYRYAPVNQGGKSYLVKTNRLTASKSYFYNGRWLSTLPLDATALRIPDPLSIKSPGDEPFQVPPPGAEDKIKEKEAKPIAAAPLQVITPEKTPTPVPPPPKAEPAPAVKESPRKPEPQPVATVQPKSEPDKGIAVPPSAEPKTKPVRTAASKQKPYAIQIGAFRSEDDLNVFLQEHKGRSDMHWTKVRIKDQIWYRVFIGHFADQSEAKRFIQKKKVDSRYPGCFVQRAG